MRVLPLFYGHYRTFYRTLPSWLSSLEGCEFVCRFVTFDTIDHAAKCWWHGNIEEHPKITTAQIDLLTTYDPNVRILSQTFSNEELDDIYATLPFKVYMYKYTNIKEMLESIDETQYDMILIRRFDIRIRTIRFNFKVVHHIWKYSTDFYIEKDIVLPNRPVVRSRFD